MSKTTISKCNCKSEFQDKTYGPQMRVHNLRDQKKYKGEGFCTVCGNKNMNLKVND